MYSSGEKYVGEWRSNFREDLALLGHDECQKIVLRDGEFLKDGEFLDTSGYWPTADLLDTNGFKNEVQTSHLFYVYDDVPF